MLQRRHYEAMIAEMNRRNSQQINAVLRHPTDTSLERSVPGNPHLNIFTFPRLGITVGAFASLGILAVVLSTYVLSYFGLHHLIYG